jgi:hypothetical protein
MAEIATIARPYAEALFQASETFTLPAHGWSVLQKFRPILI